MPYQLRSAVTKHSWDRKIVIQPTVGHSPLLTFCPATVLVPSLPICSVGQAVGQDDGTLQWKLRRSQEVEVLGFVGVATTGNIMLPQASQR